MQTERIFDIYFLAMIDRTFENEERINVLTFICRREVD